MMMIAGHCPNACLPQKAGAPQWRFDGATARITASINRNRDNFTANFSNYHQSEKWAKSLEAGGALLSIRKSREWPAGTVGGGPNRVPTRQTRPPYHDWYKSVSCEIPMSDPSPKTIRINHPTQPRKGQLSFLKAGDHLYGIPHLTCTKSECTFVQHAIMLVAFMVFNFLPVYLFQNLLWSLLPIIFLHLLWVDIFIKYSR